MVLLSKIPWHIPTCSIFWYLIRKHNPIIIPSNIIEQPFRFPILGEYNPMDESSHSSLNHMSGEKTDPHQMMSPWQMKYG